MLGRAAERERINESIDGGRSVLVFGPPGIGKTTLAESVLAGREHAAGGAVAGLQWQPYLPLMRAIGSSLDGVPAGAGNTDLDRVCTPDDTTHPSEPHTVRQCVQVVVEEGWWHNGFANRDLDVLEGA